jgi:hypothetical protein
MPGARRPRSRFCWSLCLIFLGLAAAVACASHPPNHDHDVGHPPLCTDTSSPVTLAYDKSTLLSDGGILPLSLKSFFPVVFLAALSAQLLAGLLTCARAGSLSDAHTSVSPPVFLVVLRR